jgi:hypothetical protein
MKKVTKTFTIFVIIMILSVNKSFCQKSQGGKNEKAFTFGISSVISIPLFLNALPDLGFRMYNAKTNLGFGINSKILVRFKPDLFITSITDIKAWKRINVKEKSPVDLGVSTGFGINSSPDGKFFIAGLYAGIPLWKLHLECQPSLVIPNLKSSFFSIGLQYFLKIK